MTTKTFLVGVLSVLAIVSGISYGLFKAQNNGDSMISVHSIMLPRTISELTKDSYAAIVGTVVDTKVAREMSSIRPGETDIVTIASIKIEKYLTNPNSLDLTTIQVKTLGGTIDKDSMMADDYPSFVQGTKIVVFLNKTDNGEYTVFGTAQGKFTVNEDGTLGTEKEKPYMRGVFNRDVVTLAELESEIATAVK